LSLEGTKITDLGLEHLDGFTRLSELNPDFPNEFPHIGTRSAPTP
jgi:hypothetical protein